MTLPKWIERAKDWPLERPGERACGIGCDMGEAGPGQKGQHDPDCEIVMFVEALSIAIEALEYVVTYSNDPLIVRRTKIEMRRIENLGNP